MHEKNPLQTWQVME